jgi:hypothetical protein
MHMVTAQAEGGVGGTGAESRTSITFIFLSHSGSSLEAFKRYIEKNKPGVIILEEKGDRNFSDMLEGKMTIDKYMEGHSYISPAVMKKRYEFLKEFHHNNKRVNIVQCDPKEEGMEEMSKAGAKLNLFRKEGTFEEAVDAAREYIKAYSKWNEIRAPKRGHEIAEHVRRFEWVGKIAIETGPNHTNEERFTAAELKNFKGVEVSHVHPLKEVVSKTFKPFPTFSAIVHHIESQLELPPEKRVPLKLHEPPLVEVYTPFNQLGRLYSSGREVDVNTEKLLAGRWLVFDHITQLLDNDKQFKFETMMYGAVRMINRLDYSQCQELFQMLRDGGVEASRAFRAMEQQFFDIDMGLKDDWDMPPPQITFGSRRFRF